MSRIVINDAFEDYVFDWDSYFYVLTGGYGSSKSYNTAIKILLKLAAEKRTALVVREVFDTLKHSCHSLFTEIINKDDTLGKMFKIKSSPMEIVCVKNGSKIIYRGMDDPMKLKSINDVSIVWLEEAPEIKYTGFKELIGRLRHPSLSLHMILTFNPVGKEAWPYYHFFVDERDPEKIRVIQDDDELYKEKVIRRNNTYYHHSTCDDNYFVPPSYIAQLDEMKLYDPDLYRVARQGHFGVNGIRVLPQFRVAPHEGVLQEIDKLRKSRPQDLLYRCGMDFGFVTSYNAMLRLAIDHREKILYIYWEYYDKEKTDDKTAEDLKEFIDTKELIKADSAEPKTIAYYRQLGFNIRAAKKFKGSRVQYTKKVKRFKKIICSDRCKNTIRELKSLTYKKDKYDAIIEDEFTIDPHTFSAIWYALDDYEVSSLKGGMSVLGSNKSY